MTVIRKLTPDIIKVHYRKIKWFIKNYYNISNKSILLSEKSHFLGPITYNTDSLITSNNCDFIHEPKFTKAYQAAADTKPWEGFTLQWRVYIVCWFANLVKNIEGDYVECGVNTGAYSRAIIEYINFNKLNKQFFLLDTFDGLVEEFVTEEELKAGIGSYLDKYKNVYEDVKKTFSPFKNVTLIKGRVPETLVEVSSNKVAYLSIDMNCVAPEIAALEYFWDKISKGGVVILDDYGFPPHINQKLAFDKFATKKNIEILCLPTGQGIIIKN